MKLVRERHEVMILICALSSGQGNEWIPIVLFLDLVLFVPVCSAADLYVTKHLDPYLRKTAHSQELLLRIVSRERRINAIPESARKYCYYAKDGNAFEVRDHLLQTMMFFVCQT